jgi:lactoylglutathione lyase
MMRLNLLVLYSPDPERLKSFYEELGMSFTRHRHGGGPEHFGGKVGTVLLEIYPLKDEALSTAGARIGFEVDDVVEMVTRLTAAGGTIVSPPKDSPWGLRAVLSDPDGHRIELTNH